MALQFICLNSQNYLGRGKEYVEILRDSIFRNLPEDTKAKFSVFTDDPEDYGDIHKRPIPHKLNGWYNKLGLFERDLFPEEDTIVYFDLDTVITGPLDDIVQYKGKFATLRDVYRPKGLQSSVMIWNGDNSKIWNDYKKSNCPEIEGGDQAWIEKYPAEILQDIYPERFKSYKVSCQNEIPRGCSVCFFHGLPRPHEATGWVKDFWKIGGGTALEFFNQANTNEEQLISNIEYSTSLKRNWLEPKEAHSEHAVIVGGGPSVKGFAKEIAWRQSQGQKIFTLNNSWRWLEEMGIKSDYHIMLDARPENIEFCPDTVENRFYASQCDKAIWDKYEATLWNHENCAKFVPKGGMFVSGGSTVGLNAMAIAYLQGFRQIHLYGFDSSYTEGNHHAYPQALNDNERTLEVMVGDRVFKTAPWMAEQSKQFCELAPQLVSMGCIITIHGDGLLPYMALHYDPRCAADLRSESILERITVKNPVGVEVGVFKGDLSKRLLKQPDLTLYMVDSWGTHEGSEYAKTDFHGSLSQNDQDRFYNYTKDVTRFAGERAKIMRLSSLEAADKFKDGSLDFVFLDADHTYEGIKSDIEAWFSKVKDGGWVSGHDYDNPDFPAWGVKRAVEEIGLPIELGQNYTWFVKK